MLSLLCRVRGVTPELEERRREARARAVRWLLGMQGRDGGWGAFDRNCDRRILTAIPFADHNAMIDPSTPDVSSRVVTALLEAGLDPEGVPIRRAVRFLQRQQERDGSWSGRWGANHIYGTCLALGAMAPLVSIQPAGRSELLAQASRRAGWWLVRFQNEDGGWGESLDSYERPEIRVRGASTAVQTAWAMQGLLAVVDGLPALDASLGQAVETALKRGSAHLVSSQGPDGSWRDDDWTGVGFPRVLYLGYHGYSRYFPLAALAAYGRLQGRRTRRGRPGRGAVNGEEPLSLDTLAVEADAVPAPAIPGSVAT